MSSRSKKAVPEASQAMEQFKYEVANEIGVPLKKGYNGDLTSAQNGYVGGYMVKKMIEQQEKMMAEKNKFVFQFEKSNTYILKNENIIIQFIFKNDNFILSFWKMIKILKIFFLKNEKNF